MKPLFYKPMGAAPLMPVGVEHSNENVLAEMKKLRYPVWVTIKEDGIRGVRLNGSLLSKTRHKIPNKEVVARSLIMPGGFDMEIVIPGRSYNEIQSVVMSEEHTDAGLVEFHVLDWFGQEGGYTTRIHSAALVIDDMPQYVSANYPKPIHNADELLKHFLICEAVGEEGICFRTGDSPYKQGRSTLKEQYLVKLARYLYAEGTIISFEEQKENTNSDQYNPIGYMKRSTFKEGMVGKRTVGTVVLKNEKGETIRCGTGEGLTNELRKDMWLHPEKYIGQQWTYKHKPVGRLLRPRQPILVGPRKKGF